MPRRTSRNFPGSVLFTLLGLEKVTAADAATLKPAQLAIELWIRPTNPVGGDYNALATKSTSGSWNDGYGIYFRGAGANRSLSWWVNNYTGAGAITAVTVAVATWIHVVGTYDGAAVRLYANGVQIAAATYSTPITHSTQSFTAGFHPGAGSGTDGIASGVRLWQRALSAQEVSDRYYLGRDDATMRANLGLQWDFAEQAGTSVADGSGNGNGGTLSSAAMWSVDAPMKSRSTSGARTVAPQARAAPPIARSVVV